MNNKGIIDLFTVSCFAFIKNSLSGNPFKVQYLNKQTIKWDKANFWRVWPGEEAFYEWKTIWIDVCLKLFWKWLEEYFGVCILFLGQSKMRWIDGRVAAPVLALVQVWMYEKGFFSNPNHDLVIMLYTANKVSRMPLLEAS